MGGLWCAVTLAAQIGGKSVKSGGVAVKKRLILKPLSQQCVTHCKHHGDIGVWAQLNPVFVNVMFHIRAARRQIDKFCSFRRCLTHACALNVCAGSAIADLGVEGRQAAKCHHQPGIATDRLPACLAGENVHQIATKNMRNDHLGGGIAVGVL